MEMANQVWIPAAYVHIKPILTKDLCFVPFPKILKCFVYWHTTSGILGDQEDILVKTPLDKD